MRKLFKIADKFAKQLYKSSQGFDPRHDLVRFVGSFYKNEHESLKRQLSNNIINIAGGGEIKENDERILFTSNTLTWEDSRKKRDAILNEIIPHKKYIPEHSVYVANDDATQIFKIY